MNKKGVLLIFLIGILGTTSFVGCKNTDNINASKGEVAKVEYTKDTEDSTKRATEEEIGRAKELYKEYLSKYNGEPFNETVLVDLNDDGIPELIAGNMAKSYSPISFALTVESGNITNLKFDGDYGFSGAARDGSDYGEPNIGLHTFKNMETYKDKDSNKLIYIGIDGSSISVDEFTAVRYVVLLSNGVINAKEIFYNNNGIETKVYKYMKNEISKDEYNKNYKEYYSNLELVDNKVYTVMDWGIDVTNLDKSKESSNTQNVNSDNSIQTKTDSNVVEKAESGITKEDAVKIAEDLNGTYMQYGCEGRVQAGFKVDGESSEDYYKVYGLVDGQRLSGAIYVHYKTGKAYLLSTDGTITTLPDNIYVGNFGDK